MSSSEQARALREGLNSELLRADAFYQATFDEPLYAVLGLWDRIYKALYQNLAPLGVRPDQIRSEGGNQPADALVVCNLATAGALLKLRLTELEIWTNSRAIIRDRDLWHPVITHGAEAIRAFEAAPSTSLHTFVLGIHWRHGETFDARVSRLVKVADPVFRVGSVSLTVASVASSANERVPKVTVELQPSIVFPEPEVSFARIACEIDGSVPIRKATELAEQAMIEAREQAGIFVEI